MARARKAELPELPVWNGPLPHPFYSKVLKRLLDFLLAIIMLIPAGIVMLIIAIFIKIDSPGPVFYMAPRGGYHNKPFFILKFRTMVQDADKKGGTTALNDNRITNSGRLLRKTKLDEIPQLFNIIKGDMSFIGPRPELLLYTMQYNKEQECILWVRPGMSDESSIAYISLDELVGADNPTENYEQYVLPKKNALRVSYARQQSFLLDTKLFFKTIAGVFQKIKRVSHSEKP